MQNYRPRIIDTTLKTRLKSIGAVLIEGPKQCGKTTTATNMAASTLFMAQAGQMQQNIELAQINPSLLLKGQTPRLIDEWQIAPQLWDAVRFEVDQRQAFGQFILTGSAVPADRSHIFHSGTGRISWLTMRTMSLFESGDSNGQVSLQTLFDKQSDFGATADLTLERIAFLTCRGGWPISINRNETQALGYVREYLEAIVKSDINRIDGISRREDTVRRLMRSYSRFQGSQTSITAISEDISSSDGVPTHAKTVVSYINALKQIFVIEDLPAWNPNLRSKTAIRTSDTRYFSDPSYATAALRVGPQALLQDLKTFGFLFETLCIRDLRIYSESIDGCVYHYRDKTDLECDAVVALNDGRYGLIEIKIGGDSYIEHGAQTLKKLADKIDTSKMPTPSFLMVLTAVGNYAYRRKDGVFVIPIGCLRN